MIESFFQKDILKKIRYNLVCLKTLKLYIPLSRLSTKIDLNIIDHNQLI